MRHLLLVLLQHPTVPLGGGDQRSHNSRGMTGKKRRGRRERGGKWREKAWGRWQELRGRTEIETERRRDGLIEAVCRGQTFVRGNCVSQSTSSRLIFISSPFVGSFPTWASSLLASPFSTRKRGIRIEEVGRIYTRERFEACSADVIDWTPVICKSQTWIFMIFFPPAWYMIVLPLLQLAASQEYVRCICLLVRQQDNGSSGASRQLPLDASWDLQLLSRFFFFLVKDSNDYCNRSSKNLTIFLLIHKSMRWLNNFRSIPRVFSHGAVGMFSYFTDSKETH